MVENKLHNYIALVIETLAFAAMIGALVGCALNPLSTQDNSAESNSSETNTVAVDSATEQSSDESGKLFINEKNVACLAAVDYSVLEDAEGNLTITVPNDDYTIRIFNTDKKYVAVSTQGQRYDEGDSRLGFIDLYNNNEIAILFLTDMRTINDGASIELIGSTVSARDLSKIYYATGPIRESISSEEIERAWEQLEQDMADQVRDDGIEVAIVDLPELNAENADIWASSISGNLDMVLGCPSEKYLESDMDPDRDSNYIVKQFGFDYSKYKGFYADVRPLSDPRQSDYQDFSNPEFIDSWAIDGGGFLWYIDKDSNQWFFQSTYYSVGEHVLNDNPLSKITAQASMMVDALLAPEKAYALSAGASRTFSYSGLDTAISFFIEILA